MNETQEIFNSIMIELFRESTPSIMNIVDLLETFEDTEMKFDPTKHKISQEKWSEIVNRHTRKLSSNDKTGIMFSLANIGPSMRN